MNAVEYLKSLYYSGKDKQKLHSNPFVLKAIRLTSNSLKQKRTIRYQKTFFLSKPELNIHSLPVTVVFSGKTRDEIRKNLVREVEGLKERFSEVAGWVVSGETEVTYYIDIK